MATFTIALKDLIERNPTGLPRDEFLNLHNYPIFDGAGPQGTGASEYRPLLNQKIIDHYWNREIAHESWQMFVFNLGRKMREIMPLMNQLYESERVLRTLDPLKTVALKTESKGTGEQDSTRNATSTNANTTSSNTQTVSSDTPQTMLADDEDYATGGAQSKTGSSSNSGASENGTAKVGSKQSADSETTGYQGVPAQLIMAERAAFMNLDREVIEQVKDCFFGLWNNNDEVTLPHMKGYML